MIDPSRKEANDLVKDEIRQSDLDSMMKEALIQDLTESLEGTNGHAEKEKLQIVSECTEVQARIVARLCKMESDHHKNMRTSIENLSKKFDDNMKNINDTLGKIIKVPNMNNGVPINESDGNVELKSRSQWFTFITRNKIQVFWFSVIVVVLAFITGNIDKIAKLIHG